MKKSVSNFLKSLLFILIIFMSSFGYAQTNNSELINFKLNDFILLYQPDSVFDFMWDDVNSVWEKNVRNVYAFDDTGKLITKTMALWDEDKWLLKEKIENTFSDSLLVEQVQYWWDWYYTEWAYVLKYSFTYDSIGRLTQKLFEKWSENDFRWQNDSLYKYAYNDANKPDVFISQNWSRYYSEWENSSQLQFYFDSLGNISEQIESLWEFDLLIWEPSQNTSFKYDSINNLIEQINYTINRNDTGNVWKREFSYYDNGTIKDLSHFIWVALNNNEYWLEDYKFSYNYNENGDIIEEIEYLFDWDLLVWEKNYLTSYTYFDDDLLNKVNYYQWERGDWKELEQLRFYYPGHTRIKSNWDVNVLKTYPNPADDILYIIIPDQVSGEAHVFISDLQGKKVFDCQYNSGSNPHMIQLPELKTGLYFVKVSTGNDIYINKIVIQNN